jgi:HNH endonuclease
MEQMNKSDISRFEAKIERTDKCWLWKAGLNSYGYGWFRPTAKSECTGAHRIAYMLWIGPIANGMTIDHLCRVRNCVNPGHLEAVTAKENTLRGFGAAAINRRKKECVRGHGYTKANTYKSRRGYRQCKKCYYLRTGFLLTSAGGNDAAK